MNIKFISNLILDIYIKSFFIENIDFNNIKDLEKYLKNLFKTLNNKYDIKIEGFYDITVYKDKFYGVVFHLEKEELEYYDYFKNQVDMRIKTIDTNFLYKVDDIPFNIYKKIKINVIDNDLYIKIKNKLTDLEMMKLLENSKLIYNK